MSWKAVAIIFIILFILETLTFGFIVYLGVSVVNQKEKCKQTCYNMESDAFLYDEETKICQCFKDNEVIYER